MKTLAPKRYRKHILSLISLGILCACSKNSAHQEEQNNEPDEFQISRYSSSESPLSDASVAIASEANSSLNFVNDVKRAEFSAQGNSLKLALYDSDEQKILVPNEFAPHSRYRQFGKLLFIRLSNGEEMTNAVIHTSSGKVFITKDSSIAEISLASPSSESVEYKGQSYEAVRIKVVKVGSGDTVDVGIIFVDNKLLAIKP